MGNRLSRIYTRTGDNGSTGLGDGSRVAKDSLRVEAMGAVDEVNSCLGVLLAEPLDADIAGQLTEIQHDLFDLGGELSIPGYTAIRTDQVERLEHILDAHNDTLEPLKEFILPGGNRAAGVCHLARAMCRRAERRVTSLATGQTVSPILLQYLNRLSDLLFVLARVINRRTGGGDVLWRRDRGTGTS
jgi:cob(I)alamin adenosyltransferase